MDEHVDDLLLVSKKLHKGARDIKDELNYQEPLVDKLDQNVKN